VTATSSWTTLLPGFIVGGIGIGIVNAPLAVVAVSVVEPQRAGMASGTNNTFRQVGIATGIAALGAILQSQIANHLPAAGPGVVALVASGHAVGPPALQALQHDAFVSGINDILLIASFVAFAGAVAALALVRRSDLVMSGPAVAGVEGQAKA